VKKVPVSPGIPTVRKSVPQRLRHSALSELRHNVRSPLNHVLGYSEMLIEGASQIQNAAALEALRQIHSTARAALADINAALANRDEVDASEVEALCGKIQPRVSRIEHYVERLRGDAFPPEEWEGDLERIELAVRSVLPWLGAPQPEIAAATLPAVETRPANARLLVAGEDAATRTLLRARLERLGYAVGEASAANQVTDLLLSERFDLILVDIKLLAAGGFAMLDRRTQDPRVRRVPVVVVCSSEESEAVGRAIDLGADDYLCRPLEPAFLRTRIQAVLERSRLAEQSKIGALGVLTADVARQVRSPLNFVLNSAEVAENQLLEQATLLDARSPESIEQAQQVAAELGAHLAKIRDQAERIEQVLRSIFDPGGDPGNRSL
jgi:DNA-binding response OmpR family regulator